MERRLGVNDPARATRPLIWMALALITVGGHLLVAELGMFTDWDESVFYSQSGGIVGVDSDPVSYGPSREPGTPLLIAGLRWVGLNLEAVRLAFLTIYVSLVALGWFLLSPILGWGSVVGYVIMVGHWIPLAYSARLYGVPIASAFLLVALACGARLIGEKERTRCKWWAAGVAASAIAMLAMRHLEAPIAAAVLFVTLIVFTARIGKTWFAVGAGVAALIGIVSIDALRAVYYHGSVGDWVEALVARLQGVGVNEDDAITRTIKVLGSLSGGYHLRFRDRITGPALGLTIGALILLGAVVVERWVTGRSRADASESDLRPSVRFLAWTAGGVATGYFLMFAVGRYPSIPADRYLMWFVASGAIIVGLLVGRAFSSSQTIALLFAGVLLVTSGISAARPEVTYFLNDGERLRQTGFSMHVLADGNECEALSRFTPPALQLASGCLVRQVSEEPIALAWLTGDPPGGTTRFLVYSSSPTLEDVPGWKVTSASGSPYLLWYRTAE